MSLNVSTSLLEQAKRGSVSDDQFLACIRESLPYAWNVVSDVATRLQCEGGDFADDNSTPPGDAERGQLLRLLASSSMRNAVEAHFGVRLAFQNCHTVGAFSPEVVGGTTYREFVSPRAQLLNQSPELKDC